MSRLDLSTKWVVAGAFFLAAAASVNNLVAQTPDTATLQGTVFDQSHAVIETAEVTVTNASIALKRIVRTNRFGDFTLGGLPVGTNFSVTARKMGFSDATSKSITLEGGAVVNVSLLLGLEGSTGQVTVTGTAGEVRTDTPQIGDRITGRQLEETPLLERRIPSCLYSIPQTGRPSTRAIFLQTSSCLRRTALAVAKRGSKSMELPEMIVGGARQFLPTSRSRPFRKLIFLRIRSQRSMAGAQVVR